MQQVGDAFRFAADQGYSRVFADRGQCSASDRRDFTDGDLTAGGIEEGLDVLEAAARRRAPCDDGLFSAGLGRQRMRDLCGLLQLLDQIPRQQLLDAIDRMIGDPLENIVQVTLRIDVI